MYRFREKFGEANRFLEIGPTLWLTRKRASFYRREAAKSDWKTMATEAQLDDGIHEMRSRFLVPPSFECTFTRFGVLS